MNAGLGNFAELKKELMPATMPQNVQFDGVIKRIGTGIAGLMERYCNRKLSYKDGETEICSGDRDHWYVNRFPVSLWQKVELRFFKADAWTDISGQPLSTNEETGLLHFGYTLGTRQVQVRITYCGGFWFETLEPEDAGYPSFPDNPPANIATGYAAVQANPSASPYVAGSGYFSGLAPDKYFLPDDLRLAWILQCREVWNKIDKLGIGLADKPDEQSHTGALRLSDQVKEMLRPYVRMQIS